MGFKSISNRSKEVSTAVIKIMCLNVEPPTPSDALDTNSGDIGAITSPPKARTP
jgi:hypothetical protein